MKKILVLLTMSMALFSACNSDDEATKPQSKGQLDPNALVTISPAKGVKVRAIGDADSDTAFSALEVMLRAHSAHYYTQYSGHRLLEREVYTGVGFAPEQKDTANAKLRFWGTQIISDNGMLLKGTLYARDIVIVGGDPSLGEPRYGNSTDTLAYIPNAVIREARAKIEQAYRDSNFTEVYRLFDEALTYIPCTAKQYKELKALSLIHI